MNNPHENIDHYYLEGFSRKEGLMEDLKDIIAKMF